MIKNFLNPEGHQNQINGSKVTTIFTEGVNSAYWWSFSVGGSAINGATQSSFCVFWKLFIFKNQIKKLCPIKYPETLKIECCNRFIYILWPVYCKNLSWEPNVKQLSLFSHISASRHNFSSIKWAEMILKCLEFLRKFSVLSQNLMSE